MFDESMKLCLAAALGATASYIANKMLANQKEEKCEVLFFPDVSVHTFDKRHFTSNPLKTCSNFEIDGGSSLAKLISYLRCCKRSIDVCVMIFTCHEFASELIKLKKSGVGVRVIVDRNNMDAPGCQVGRLREAMIPVRGKQQSSIMHHKFAIVDSSLLINGSFNWTGSAVFANNENVVITQQNKIVTPFIGEFNKLWKFHALK